mgnify:FL=1|jgi:hypothetical protein|tara:strand:- start:275 stop:787 length:513 start_codon:yes stop_codon:yes gene_type:complete
MRITVKNVKTFDTMDGMAWDATVYIDGTKVGSAHNDGNGGGAFLHMSTEDEQRIEDHVKTLCWFRYDGETGSFVDCDEDHPDGSPQNAEILIETLIENAQQERRMKRALKNKAALIIEGKPGITTYSWKGCKQVTDRHLEKIRTKHPEAILLNDMPHDEALKVWVQHVFA